MNPVALGPQQIRVLRAGRWFSGLPAELQDALVGAARLVVLRAGDRLFLRGDANDGLYAVLTGGIRFGSVNEQGRESTFAIAERSTWFGEVALLDDGCRTHDAFAESRTTLVHVPLADITRWLQAHPAHWRHVGQLAVLQLRLAFAVLEDLSLYPPRERVVRCLVKLARGYDERADVGAAVLRISQERLGRMLMLTRQTVNGVLKDLEEDGLVVRARGGLRIRDVKRLAREGTADRTEDRHVDRPRDRAADPPADRDVRRGRQRRGRDA